ncbi:DNA repair protein RecN [Chachezhania antarctica]|uniref:DNA repair protein RecN n=1 Tax=Chachezhania antarctica TaxID=2340860 RepID=UPI000EB108BB|nr:DNA repair protein RecN [Chachezhania antarctica]|tara:strand:+ start:2822 stop:4471 length:1650 start_codon:yes stop_codon:yes gene_type:complete
MLRALDIRDMLIIDRLDLQFRPGLNVLTGETGAGKSILLDSLGFVLGWRGRAELVRQGAEQGEVTAVFEIGPDHPAHAVLEDAGIPPGDELILRRINMPDGRKTAWINDRRCSGQVLRDLSETLVELHGQHDDRGLLNPRGHRDLLDDFAGAAPARDMVRTAWTARQKAAAAVEEAREKLEAARSEEEFLRHAVEELDKLSPEPGEDADLDMRRRTMQAAERIRDDVARAHALLGTDAAEGMLGEALRWLEGVSDTAAEALEPPIAALGRVLEELGEAQSGVERCLEALQFDTGELEDAEERLFAIRAMARKHGVAPDDLGTFADTLRERLAALDAGDANLADLEAAAKKTAAAYDEAAGALTALRTEAAGRLDAAVMAELAPLKMDRAVFATKLEPAEPGPSGRDAVAFTVATNPGAPSGPLDKIASGGELSRFLLALKVCLTGEDSQRTLIFDEIDRGVGGATADAVGRRLKALADNGQVLVVTHSPQVAALGAHHWRVEKRVADDMTLSSVTDLAPDDRVDEIARMLSGDKISAEARAAAKSLLDG